jgi:hypothetical protein
MKNFAALVFIISLSSTVAMAQHPGHGGGGPAPRPVAVPHPTVVRPADHPPMAGPHPELDRHPVENHGPVATRPVLVDPRSRGDIHAGAHPFNHFADPHLFHPDPRWGHFFGATWAWNFGAHYAWTDVQTVTCQAVDNVSGAIYTQESSRLAWEGAWGAGSWINAETSVGPQLLNEALNECANAPGSSGNCTPLENPGDFDGCFLSYN